MNLFLHLNHWFFWNLFWHLIWGAKPDFLVFTRELSSCPNTNNWLVLFPPWFRVPHFCVLNPQLISHLFVCQCLNRWDFIIGFSAWQGWSPPLLSFFSFLGWTCLFFHMNFRISLQHWEINLFLYFYFNEIYRGNTD